MPSNMERTGLLGYARKGHLWPLIFFLALIILAAWMFYGPDHGERVEVNTHERPAAAVAPGAAKRD